VKAAVWIVMMVVWLAGLVSGAWWVWPHFERMELTGDLVFSAVWLIIGTAAWVVAAGFGWQRFFRRPGSGGRGGAGPG
jgi:hypothetical protein